MANERRTCHYTSLVLLCAFTLVILVFYDDHVLVSFNQTAAALEKENQSGSRFCTKNTIGRNA